MVTFEISGTSDRFWNKHEFVRFLSQNQGRQILLTVVPEAICLRSLGVYELLDCFEFESVDIETWNPLEKHEKYTVHYRGPNFWFYRKFTVNEELHDWDETHTFFCLYHRPTAGRLALASYLSQYSSAIHFSSENNVDYRIEFEFDKLFQYHPASLPRAANLALKLPVLLGSKKAVTDYLALNATPLFGYDFSDPLTNWYKSILIDVVVESHVSGNTFFPTEKTIRSIVMKKPFIVFASANYLDYLHQMGFLTFGEWWSEDYDGYEQGARLEKIYEVIDSIARLDRQDLIKMYWEMKFVLDHNYNLFQSKKFLNKITPI